MAEVKRKGSIQSRTVGLTFKLTLYLFLRVVLVVVLCFMSIPIGNVAKTITYPLLAVFYLIVLLYFFIYTAHFEGGSDRNRIETELIRKNSAKGFISSGILVGLLLLISAVPHIYGEVGFTAPNLFCRICLVIYYIFSMSVSYAAQLFVGVNAVELPDTINLEHLYIRFAVFVAVYIICFIAAGISYKLGLDDKHPLKPFFDRVSAIFSK